ncbi:calmodulin-binding transcription activator 2-like [Pistacia vera]|uniref:calmodulin-binding transcription activator 2-like n=1 Tax=Pistacia vera TaxID=55513 RepID=UPI001262BB64|nr:calmodulin-binding transcription activator 2-like [Pistacia vera]
MANRGSYASGPRLDIQQLQMEAQHRWLRPAEISEILWNYQKFQISSEPPNRPSSGSLFLFDRKVLRYFRKDGHNWRKKKDGKTVKEAHEKLKVGSVDVLHCYYAHGEENENFQRRCYWLLEHSSIGIKYFGIRNETLHSRSLNATGSS